MRGVAATCWTDLHRRFDIMHDMDVKTSETATGAAMPTWRHKSTADTVVHLVPAMEQGGVETVVCDLNRELVHAGWRSIVISRGGRLADRICTDGGAHIALDLKSKNPLTAPIRAWQLGRTLEKIAPDIVCAHSRVPAWLFVAARRLRPSTANIPFVTYAHGANSVSIYSAVMTKGDVVIVPSRFMATFMAKNYDAGGHELAGKIRVIHPAVDCDRFDPAKIDAGKVASLRREWGISDSDHVVMAIGRITPLKGFDHLIRDLAGRIDVTPDAEWGDMLRSPRTKLVIVGGADARHLAYETELRKLAWSLGVASRVVFAGSRDCVPECLAVADMVVSGNVDKPESFGLSVAEALAMNRPVRLLRRFGGAAEILDEVGRLRGNAADGHTAMSQREAVKSMYSTSVMAQATLNEYTSLRSRRRP